MQEQRKKSGNLFSIIVAIGVIVVLVIGILVWRNWEASHEDELKSFIVSTKPVAGPIETSSQSTVSVSRPDLPKEPEALLAMAEEALRDEGYFEDGDRNRGAHVYYLLKKALECDGDAQKVEELCQRLRECSAKSNYGDWFVSSHLFDELDEKIKEAKES